MKKPDSKQLSLVTTSVLGQPPWSYDTFALENCHRIGLARDWQYLVAEPFDLKTESTDVSVPRHDPDNYMVDLTTLTMNQDGSPKNKLYADYMAHYPDDNTTELINPKLEIFRIDKPPTIITAEKGWVTEDNEVILLSGNTRLLQLDTEGNRELEIITNDVRVLMDQ